MGCWNATCAVSKLPIEYGDKIATTALVVEQLKSDYLGGGFSYAFELANPMSLFFFGEYNDYGGIEPEMSKLDQLLFADLTTALNKDGGLPVTVSGEDPEYFFNDLIERSEVSYGDNPVCIYHVRREIFDRLVNHVKNKPYNPYNGEETIEQVYRREMQKYFKPVDPLSSDFWDRGAVQYMLGYFKAYGVFLSLMKIVREKNNPTYTEYVVDKFVELAVFNTALSNLRMHWGPQSGAGSQDSDVDIHAELIDVIADEIDAIKSKYVEDEEE